MNHYEVLGVEAKAQGDEVHQAYVRLARRHHPDFFVSASPKERAAAEARMREINEAWSVLGDVESRRRYDESLGLHLSTNTPFLPFDTGEDDPDPLSMVDIPYRVEPEDVLERRRFVMMAPVGAAMLGVLMLLFAFLMNSAPLFKGALVIFGVAVAGFLAMPLLALNFSKRDEG